MKRYLCAFLVILFMFAGVSCSWAGYYDEGHSGLTEDDAYVIDSIADMVDFRDRVNAGSDSEGLYYKLAVNLNLEQYSEWAAIGRGSNPFRGHFDGNGHTIKVKIDGYLPVDNNTSLFGDIYTESGYAVRNLTVSGTLKRGYSAAGIARYLHNASIENCTFTGTIISNAKILAASNPDSGKAYSGGIVQHMLSGTIKNCTVKNSVITANPEKASSTISYVGGIVSRMASGTIENCHVDENTAVNGTSMTDSQNYGFGQICAGGIVGCLNVYTVLSTGEV